MLEESVKIFEYHKDDILKKTAALFGFKLDILKRLGSFESFVYEFEKNDKPYILKITHSLHRTKELILGELDWVKHLAANDVSVCRVMLSLNGELVEVIETGDSYFLTCVYGKALGEFTGPETWHDELFEKWGRVMGRMHRVTMNYKPPNSLCQRFQWFEDDSLKAKKYLPSSQRKVIDKCHDQIEKLKKLSTDNAGYGLIHSDLHYGNFKVNNGSITVFDFDDCHYNYFAYDIAIPIYYVLLNKAIGIDNLAFAKSFMKHFMCGYKQENQIGSSWMAYIPDFLKLRELDLYIIIHREKISAKNEWCRRFMDGKQAKIENDVPVIDLDFTKF